MTQAEEAAFLQEAAQAIRQVVWGYCQVGWFRLREEMEQECWVKVLADRASFDVTRSRPYHWVRMVTSRHLVTVLTRLASPVHLPRGQIRRARQGDLQAVAEPFEDRHAPLSRDQPDQQFQQAEQDRMRADWTARVQDLVIQILAGWNPEDRQICVTLLGLEGRAFRPRQVARLLGCEIGRVYQVHQQLEREIRDSPQLYLLFREMGDHDGEESIDSVARQTG